MKRLLTLLPILWLWSWVGLDSSTAQQWLPGGSGSPIVCAFNTTPPTLTTGLFIYAQCDHQGQLLVSGGGGGGGGGAITAPLGTQTAAASVAVTEQTAGNFIDIGTFNSITPYTGSGSMNLLNGLAGIYAAAINPPNVLGQTNDQTAVTAGTTIPWEGSLNGKGVVLPYALPGQIQDLAPAGQTGTSPITILAASGSSSLSEYMTSLQIGRSDAGTTAITATVTDATLSFVYIVPNGGGGGGNNITFPVAMKFAANHAVTCTASAGVTTFYCYAQGYNAP